MSAREALAGRAAGPSSPVQSVAFLFNHDQIHQVAHSAPTAFELSRLHPELSVTLLATSTEQANALASIARRFPGQRCAVRQLEARGALAWLDRAVGRLVPLHKAAVLRSNVDALARFDALVVPEKTSLALRGKLGPGRPKLIHTRHGAGDRAVGFDPRSAEFDLVLLPGEKVRRRLAEAGALPERWAIVGYPKLDAVDALESGAKRLFDNDRPTVLYNPHFAPKLSSYYGMGREIVEFFCRSRDYNLVFAPHVMLFRRRLRFAGLVPHWVRELPREAFGHPHVRIDLGSPACVDMTYTAAADVYLGDVSSQVCEFLLRPRPCLFANPHRIAWRGDPSFDAWRLGPVFERAEELPARLSEAIATHGSYRDAQLAYVHETFDLSEVPSSRRAAEAIAGFLCGPA